MRTAHREREPPRGVSSVRSDHEVPVLHVQLLRFAGGQAVEELRVAPLFDFVYAAESEPDGVRGQRKFARPWFQLAWILEGCLSIHMARVLFLGRVLGRGVGRF